MSDLPDEDTIRTRRTRSGAAPEPAADDAAIHENAPHDTVSADTVPADTVPAEPEPDEDRPARRRSTYIDSVVDDDPTDGSTIVARRESRRRAAREHAAGADTGLSALRAPSPPPAVQASRGRVASAPDTASSAVYGARAARPVVAWRAAAPGHAPQAPVDGAAAEAGRRRKTRLTALVVVIAASGVALAGAASLIALTLTP